MIASHPKPGEDDELRDTAGPGERRQAAAALRRGVSGAVRGRPGRALSALGVVWRKVGELAAIDDRFAPHLAAREPVKPSLEDLSFFLRSYAADIDASPARLQEVEDRLAALERLKKKHGPSLADVLAKAQALRQELDLTQNGAERSAELDTRLAAAREPVSRAGRAPDVEARTQRRPSSASAREVPGRTRHGENSLRGSLRAGGVGDRVDRPGHRTGRVLHLAKSRAKT